MLTAAERVIKAQKSNCFVFYFSFLFLKWRYKVESNFALLLKRTKNMTSNLAGKIWYRLVKSWYVWGCYAPPSEPTFPCSAKKQCLAAVSVCLLLKEICQKVWQMSLMFRKMTNSVCVFTKYFLFLSFRLTVSPTGTSTKRWSKKPVWN